MPKQSIISGKTKCTLIVSQKMHNAIVDYARIKEITVQEATYRLLLMGFSAVARGQNGELLKNTEFST